ncbi:MAG: hypothetical protein PHY92_02490 [Alphaproteobacteria bacterium]|nr:hypothetical protein [Alphaproteobacteria bacterium]
MTTPFELLGQRNMSLRTLYDEIAEIRTAAYLLKQESKRMFGDSGESSATWYLKSLAEYFSARPYFIMYFADMHTVGLLTQCAVKGDKNALKILETVYQRKPGALGIGGEYVLNYLNSGKYDAKALPALEFFVRVLPNMLSEACYKYAEPMLGQEAARDVIKTCLTVNGDLASRVPSSVAGFIEHFSQSQAQPCVIELDAMDLLVFAAEKNQEICNDALNTLSTILETKGGIVGRWNGHVEQRQCNIRAIINRPLAIHCLRLRQFILSDAPKMS